MSRAWRRVALLAVAAVLPAHVSAQERAAPRWTLIPSVGAVTLRDGGTWNSAGASVALDYSRGAAGWQVDGHVFRRGLGVSCSHACVDDAWGIAVGGSRSVGGLLIGAGAGPASGPGSWQLQAYARVAWDVGPLRLQMRAEVPLDGDGLYVPFLVGLRP